MEAVFNQIPEKIQGHLFILMKSAGMPDNKDTAEQVVANWLEKKRIFEEKTQELGMKETDSVGKNDERACLAMTYSGSLVNIGPLKDGLRRTNYASIGLRKDVPDLLSSDESVLSEDINVDASIYFTKGPIKKTSSIYRIVVCDEQFSPEEQEEQIENITMQIVEDFVEVNNDIV